MANNRHHPLLLAFLSAFFLAGSLVGSELTRSPLNPPATPSKELAVELLSLRDERFAKDYTVALIVPGEAKFKDITVSHAASVTYFGPEIENGKKKRQLLSETFLWNEEYGWFLYEFGERLSLTTVFIWSELKGEVEID
ncbi:hypothetical protein [Roseibacillus persicicus]|uniref:hypothetical protein n=1 Tax=Roseibacillus persicicus TaxID=454148 RepID=UPI00280DE683|nr:hypothetical protein [Roseibacillus persicicus]MDQ8191023.1 hypothetical protein [Roseibacillus persicicus]